MNNGTPLGVTKENKSSKYLQKIKLIPNHMNNNPLNKLKNQEINSKKNINKNNNSNLPNKEINNYIDNPKKYKNYTYIKNNKKVNTPKTPLLTTKQSLNQINKSTNNTIQYNDSEAHQLHNRNKIKPKNNFFIKDNKNKNFLKSYISPVFDYNVKNNHKTNIHLNLKNSNSKPIKLQNDGYKNLYTNRKYHVSNLSMDMKSTSLCEYQANSNRNEILKKFSINSKNSKNSLYKNNPNNNYNKGNRKYISYTPDCSRKAAFIKNKNKSVSNELKGENKSKEVIKKIFEKEFNDKMIIGNKVKNNKSNNNSLITSYSRNRKDNIKGICHSHNQSQKNILKKNEYISNEYMHKNRNMKNVYNTINVGDNCNNNKSKKNIEKYYSILKQKIKKLNNEIEEIRDEEKSLILQLIDYKGKESECKYIRQLREEINKYKNVIEKTNNACEEYSKEILKIKNIIGEN